MKKLLMVVVCLTFAVPSFALTGVSFGVKGGLVMDYDQPGFVLPDQDTENMTVGGVQVRVSTLPMVDVIVTGEYAWNKETYAFSGQSFDLKRHDWQFSASAVYPFELEFVSPYLGGGLATHSLGFDFTTPTSWSLEDYEISVPEDETKLGYHLVAGFEVKVPTFPLNFNGEFRMNWVDTPHEMTKYNSLTAGLSFSLP